MGQTQTHNAIACFVPSSNNGIKGTVKFHQNGKCEIKLQGLIPNHTHAIHIHEFGDCSSFDAKSAGGHWNPNNKQHGEWGSESHHKGDIANLFADSSGNSSLKFETDLWSEPVSDFAFSHIVFLFLQN